MLRLAQLVEIQLARREQGLPQLAVDLIAIDIGVGVSVGAQRLALAERVVKRAPVPQAHVVEHGAIAREIDVPFFVRGELDLRLRMIQAEGRARGFDVALEERPFERQLIRLDV